MATLTFIFSPSSTFTVLPVSVPQRMAYRVCLLFGLCLFQTIALAQSPKKDAQAAYSTNSQTIAAGKQLFQQHCSACHNFSQRGIGPNLATVTSDVSAQWIKAFIHNAPEVIARGDARAKQLFDNYKQAMPAFQQLNNTDLDALMAYIHAQRQQTPIQDNSDQLGPPQTNPIAAGIASAGLRLDLTEMMTAPATSQKIPLARINKMQVMPGPGNRLFIQDMRGTLYEMVGNSVRTFMSIPNERPGFINEPGLGTGLGSYAFHPDFQQNGLFYTTHTEKANAAPADFAYADSIRVSLQWVLTEWKQTDPTAPTFSGSGRELLRINMVAPMHGVQEITFNPLAKPGSPDYGMLYIGVGDGGSTENKAYFLCKDHNQIWGKVLRINPKGRNSKNGRYGIPADNPFANATDSGTLREVFCRGFRNPNRISWTPDGTMLISDIGQAQLEELNVGIAGADYGWPEREGTFVMNYQGKMDRVYPLPANDSDFHYTYPAVQYDHNEGNAISAGFVYTGSAAPALRGKYVFGDVVNGRVYCVESSMLRSGKQATVQELSLRVAGQPTTFRQLTNRTKTDLRFGVGPNGDFYFYTKTDGKIYKLTGCSPE
ncbi:PQQ-dependent sugar dehydrogenase [Spirosoma sp. KNUC1025]|uniref:PQQ-dependent sugar dehydrogenase n=1 Tax=Spirosoma sp. KNUC1025 TaxID=2894082 RepID=UPI003862D977|nr:PQQ-dependent sugar dehydrogenase [Spirosoma sp. KNUC1025]